MKIFMFTACLLVIFLELFLDVHAKYDDKQIQNYKKAFENCTEQMEQQKGISEKEREIKIWKCTLDVMDMVEKGKIQVHKLIRTCTWSMDTDCKEDLCYKLAVKCICKAYEGKTDEEKLDILTKCGITNGLMPLLTEEGI